MKSKLIIISICMALTSASYVFANEEHEHKMKDGTTMSDGDMSTGTIDVGNKICPVSGDKIGSMGPGMRVEHKGKIYNLCCPGCEKQFNEDPEKYSTIADEEVKEIQVDPHRDHNHNNS